MSDDQVSLPYFLAILVLSGLALRYLFYGGESPRSQPAQETRSPEELQRAREAAIMRVMQMFPSADRRTILWDLQNNGGNIQITIDRLLSGALPRPPITFQPPPPPAPSTRGRQADTPSQPDLITRYNLKEKLDTSTTEQDDKKGKAWSSNRDERQMSLQKRRDDMILAARKKMEAKLAAEKAAEN